MTKPSLHVWLAVALALAAAAPAAAGTAAWVAAGTWQSSREAARERAAVGALRTADLTMPDGRKRLALRLADLRVEAEVVEQPDKSVGPGVVSGGAMLTTAGFPLAKDQAGRFTKLAVGPVAGALWVRPESSAARFAIAIGAGAVALIAALILAVVFLRRWVVTPLARLAADADRIAGGELEVTPIKTRAREVAQVGEAMHGMAGALGTALDASAAAERDRRFLVTAIAHDLRTPLFTLRGSLEALERGLGDGRYLGLAQERASHLDQLVTDLFAFSRFEYAREAGDWAEVDLAALARYTADALATDVDVRVHAEPAIVQGDAQALQRVLTNLLDNALRHSRERVDITTQRVNGTVTVEVVDDGPGFAEADLPRAFEPLFRGDRARGGSHAGLGLAIARRLARAHGGDVEAANAAGGGARLTVHLPAA